jgi:tetratricopeptide (TPR) repeat protein
MKLNLRAWISGIALAGLLLSTGCAGTPARDGLSWPNLPSPWATMKKSPAKPQAAAAEPGPSLLSKMSGKAPIGKTASSKTASSKSPAKSKAASKEQEATNVALLRGRNFERAGEWDKARAVYEEVRQKDPENADIAHRLGVVADAQKRHAEAELLFQFALQREPQNATVLSDLGYCYFLQGQLSKAESALLKATRLESTNPRHTNNLGLVLGHQGRYDEALQCFRAAGSEADAQYNLAFVYAAQEQAEKAKSCFESALAADPLHRRAREALSSFEEYERLPKHLRELNDIAENGVRYVPYVEGSEKGGVEQASAQEGVSTSFNANRSAQALHAESRGMLNRNMASQRADDMSGK